MNSLEYVIIGSSFASLANEDIPQFIEGAEGLTSKISKVTPKTITLKDNRKFIFISRKSYPTWCKGRTYMIGNKKYHSGYEIDN